MLLLSKAKQGGPGMKQKGSSLRNSLPAWLNMFSWWVIFSLFLEWVEVVGQDDGIIITEADFQALVAIRHAFSDPRNVLKTWNASPAGACSGSWLGVKCAQGQVIALHLPGKGLGGRVAEEVGQLVALRKLNLHTNHLEGQIPTSLSFLQNLRGLYLFQNRFSGRLPPIGLAMASSVLQAVDVSRNQLSGPIPSHLTSSSHLFLIDFSYNNFSGSIPSSLASQIPSLRDLRLNNNQLQGSIPSELGQLANLSILDLSDNHLDGSMPASFSNISSIVSLNLAHNDLTGSFSFHLERLQKLQFLNISRNNLTGRIPTKLGNLRGLAMLDLSQNHFNGSLPSSLAGLKNLSSFDCSYNNLTGPVPFFSHKFNATSFVGNAGLCGYSSSVPCAPSPAPSATQLRFNMTHTAGRKKKQKITTLILVFIIFGSAIVGILLICLISLILWQCGCIYLLLVLCGCRKREEEKFNGVKSVQSSGREAAEVAGKLVDFDCSLNFSADDLLCATAEVLGKSTYGTVYKATLEDGSQIAVKRLREGIVKSQRDVENEITTLGKIRHPNLLALRAYYWGAKDEKLLIYDFMPGGSLAAFLHARGPDTPLIWEIRMKIATGAARGLAFLHDHEKIIHGNLTSSNILLDSQMNAKLSDYGLSRLMTIAANSTVMATMSALGYRAPELTKLRKATTKSDVYSFGIVLLELLTGKAPGETASSEIGMDLPEWVTSVVKEEWTNEIFDIELMKGAITPSDDELINTLQLALNCVSLAPNNRPEMAEAVERLEQIKPDLRQSGLSTSAPAV